ncbi:hypothetical protein [Microbacterium sp. AR7-10]|uniref:hypothetical protein n=1 Tax=Microbacterium sp. AR7-10 TaxID=1891970 RepID=UPI0008FC39A6|nr:hypothetical protein [Microbacterium sp. AR7-10]OIU87702.1 hypothetical protein BFN01_08175 [Microbacterium sp. AR7-10]
MEYDEPGNLDGVPIRTPKDQGYRTCSECGGDCEPDPSISVEGQGARIAFVCPDHGVQSIVDPFEEQR